MRDQVVMSPNNGYLCIAVPLFRYHPSVESTRIPGFYFSLIESNKPMAYVLDMDKNGCKVLSAEWVEKYLEFLGDL